jgi:hypothetical protein
MATQSQEIFEKKNKLLKFKFDVGPPRSKNEESDIMESQGT